MKVHDLFESHVIYDRETGKTTPVPIIQQLWKLIGSNELTNLLPANSQRSDFYDEIYKRAVRAIYDKYGNSVMIGDQHIIRVWTLRSMILGSMIQDDNIVTINMNALGTIPVFLSGSDDEDTADTVELMVKLKLDISFPKEVGGSLNDIREYIESLSELGEVSAFRAFLKTAVHGLSDGLDVSVTDKLS
jgi:hypothetical protein